MQQQVLRPSIARARPAPPTVAHRTPPLPPALATLTPEQKCHSMPLSPQPHHLTLAPGNPSLTNADQTVTKVDTRLTRVDKTDHRQPPPHSQTPAKHSAIATAPAIQTLPVSTPVVNPSTPSRTNLNNPEQIRTTPNTAEHSDQIGPPPGSPPNNPEKTTLNTVVARSQPPTPHLTSPLTGGRDELGKGACVGLAVGGKCKHAPKPQLRVRWRYERATPTPTPQAAQPTPRPAPVPAPSRARGSRLRRRRGG